MRELGQNGSSCSSSESNEVQVNQPGNTIFKIFTGHERLKNILFTFFALCILAVSLTFFVLSIGKPYMGVTLSKSNQVWTVESVDPNGLAVKAGISIGDSLVEINGEPAETFLQKYSNVGIVSEILIEEMTVMHDSGQRISVTLQGSTPSTESVIELVTMFVTALIFWLTGFYVFFKRRRNIAAFLLCLCGLAIGLTLGANVAAARAVPASALLAIIATTIGPWLLLHFFLVLPEENTRLRRNPFVYLIYLPALITLILLPLVGYADGQPLSWFRTFRVFEIGAVFLAICGVVIFSYLRSTSLRTRQQMKIVLISCLLALIPFIFLSILPEAILGQTVLPPGFSILFVAFIPLGMGYAVVTRKLMDIDVVIRRGIIYGSITAVMTLILSAAIFLTAIFSKPGETFEKILIALGLGITTAVLFGPIRKGIELLVDKLFYKDRYDYRQIIQSLSTSMNLLKDYTDISRLIVGTTVNTLNLEGGCLFVKGPSKFFELNTAQGTFTDADKQIQLLKLISQRNSRVEFPNSASIINPAVAFIIPLITAEKEVGVLCLSQKASRQAFSNDDIFLLEGLASVSAAELRSAMLIREVSMRDTFVSIASHELRTPLTSIIGYAELLQRRDFPEATRKQWIKNILDSGQKIAVMVDDLLNVARIQTGKAGFKPEAVRLPDVIEEQLAFIRESTSKHEFVIETEPELPQAFVDRDKFGQVLANLLNNAVKYSPNGGHITLSVHNDLPRHRLVVSVADEGIGISLADRDSLFTTFHRILRTETRGIRGSGLGLYIVKEWIEMMGGEVWLESEMNKGSKFFVSIPTLNAQQQSEKTL